MRFLLKLNHYSSVRASDMRGCGRNGGRIRCVFGRRLFQYASR